MAGKGHGLTRSNHWSDAVMSGRKIVSAEAKRAFKALATTQVGTPRTRRLLCGVCAHRCFSFSCAYHFCLSFFYHIPLGYTRSFRAWI